MSLRTKIILAFMLFVAALGLVNIVATGTIIDRRVRTELETSEVLFAKSLAVRMAKSTRARERPAITEVILDEQGLRSQKIAYVVVFGPDRKLLAHTFLSPLPRSILTLAPRIEPSARDVTLIDNGELFAYDVAVPVIEGIEQVGAVHVGLRGAYIEGIRDDVVRSSFYASLAISAVAFAVAFALGFRLVRPLGRLTSVVKTVAAGNWDGLKELGDRRAGKDEVGVLSAAFAEMGASVLEKTRAIQLVLDNTGDGLLSADLTGKLSGQVSAEAIRYFGEPEPADTVWDYLLRHDAELRLWFSTTYAEFACDVMPFEILADQMPQRFTRDGKTFRLSYRQVSENEVFSRLLIIVRDVTELLAAERQSEEARELHVIIGHLLRDRQTFQRFLTDSQGLLTRLASATDLVSQKRDLHTLKGNLAVMGFSSTSHQCHQCEDELAESQEPLSAEQFAALNASWQGSIAALSEQVPLEDEADLVAIRGGEYDRLLRKLEGQTDHKLLLSLVRSWRFLPMASVLHGFAAQAIRLGKILDKEVTVRIHDQDLRVDVDAASDFWPCLVHVVRNAVDHGLESTDERIEAGKPAKGSLSLATYTDGGQLVVVVADDGRGIDWDAVRQRAGMPSDTPPERLQDFLFADGFSTRAEATDTSGRGVGLAALKQACVTWGIQVSIKTSRGKGTSFIFRFPPERTECSSYVAAHSIAPPLPEGIHAESSGHMLASGVASARRAV
jgi:signal transduction histidine kinase/HAMP domain-containing protein